MFGEIYLCRFPFTDSSGSKIRPVVVLFDLGQDAVICRVTGKWRSGRMDVVINEWKTAGLLKPSVAMLDRIITAEKPLFVSKLGSLAAGLSLAGEGRYLGLLGIRPRHGRFRDRFAASCSRRCLKLLLHDSNH
jgi:mRNA interferase MazF